MRNLKALLHDDDSAVSPVIGVILMVAITVILAAVIASFVLGLGDQTDDVSPNIVFDADYENVSDNGVEINATVTVNTADGDADADTVYVRGDNVSEQRWSDYDGGDTLSAGESIVVEAADQSLYPGDEIIIVFETDDTSDTLDTLTVPDI